MSNNSLDNFALATTLEELEITRDTLITLQSTSSLSLEEVIETIETAIKQKVDKLVYVFQKYDSIAKDNWGNANGYAIYERIGNTLKAQYNKNDLPDIDKTIEILQQMTVSYIITGNIQWEFLGIPNRYEYNEHTPDSPEYNPDNSDEITTSALDDREIAFMQQCMDITVSVRELSE